MVCKDTDNKGDPADAVPLANQLIAGSSNLVIVLGGDGDTATAITPLFDQAHITMFTTTGQAAFDHSTLTYFWRDVPPDESQGYGMALAAQKLGYTRVALLFGNDVAAQGSAPAARKGAKALGLNIVADQTLSLDQPSYRTEVKQLIAAHPQVIISEADPQTTGTYLSELKQLGSLIPIVSDTVAFNPPWTKAVANAVGASEYGKLIYPLVPYAPTGSVAYKTWVAALLASRADVQQASSWTSDLYSAANYDSVTIAALAMIEAHSTSPQKFNAYITKVTNPSAGAVIVHTYAAGKAALAAGKRIQYIGASGPIIFNQYHNSTPTYAIERSTASGHVTVIAPISGKGIQALAAKS